MEHCTRVSCIGLSAPISLHDAVDVGCVLIIVLLAAFVMLRILR